MISQLKYAFHLVIWVVINCILTLNTQEWVSASTNVLEAGNRSGVLNPRMGWIQCLNEYGTIVYLPLCLIYFAD